MDLSSKNLHEKQRRKDVKAIIKGFPKQKSFAFKALQILDIQQRVLDFLVSYDVRFEGGVARSHASRQQRDLVSMSLTCKAFWWNAMQVKWRELIDPETLLNIWREIGMLEKNQEGWSMALLREPQALDWATIYRYMSQVQTLRFVREPTYGAWRQPQIIFLVRQLYNAAKGPTQDQILCNVANVVGLMPRLFPSLRILEWECIFPVDLQCLGMVVLASPEIDQVVIDIPDLSNARPEDRWLWDYHLFFLLEVVFVHARPIRHLEINRLPILNPDPHWETKTSTAAIIRYVIRASGLCRLVLPAEAMACITLFRFCCLSESLQSLRCTPSIAVSISDRPPAGLAAPTNHPSLKHISATTRVIKTLLSSPEGICAGLEQLLVFEDAEVPRIPARALPETLAYFGTRFASLRILWLQTTLIAEQTLPHSYSNAMHLTQQGLAVKNPPVLAWLWRLNGLEELHIELKFAPEVPWSSTEASPPAECIMLDEDWKMVAKFWPKLRKLWYSCEPSEVTPIGDSSLSQAFQYSSAFATEGNLDKRVATIESILTLLATCQSLQSVTVPFTCRQRDCSRPDYTRQAALLPQTLRQRGLESLEIGLNFADVDRVGDDVGSIVNFWNLVTWGVKNARFTGVAHPTFVHPGGIIPGNAMDGFINPVFSEREWRRQTQWMTILGWVEKRKPN